MFIHVRNSCPFHFRAHARARARARARACVPKTQTGVVDLNECCFLNPLDLICFMLIWLSVAATARPNPNQAIMSATGNNTNTDIYVPYQDSNTFTQSPSVVSSSAPSLYRQHAGIWIEFVFFCFLGFPLVVMLRFCIKWYNDFSVTS